MRGNTAHFLMLTIRLWLISQKPKSHPSNRTSLALALKYFLPDPDQGITTHSQTQRIRSMSQKFNWLHTTPTVLVRRLRPRHNCPQSRISHPIPPQPCWNIQHRLRCSLLWQHLLDSKFAIIPRTFPDRPAKQHCDFRETLASQLRLGTVNLKLRYSMNHTLTQKSEVWTEPDTWENRYNPAAKSSSLASCKRCQEVCVGVVAQRERERRLICVASV